VIAFAAGLFLGLVIGVCTGLIVAAALVATREPRTGL
jgi:hypothetical protein